MSQVSNRISHTLSTLTTTYRAQLLATLWLPIVGFGAYGLSKFAPDGEAAGGVVLAAIALGAYRLTGWAIDLLAPLLVERLVWPLLGERRKPDGLKGPAFSSAARMLHYSGRDVHFGKHPELKEEIGKIEKHLSRITSELEKSNRGSSGTVKEYASLAPRRHIKVDKMMDLSGIPMHHVRDVRDDAVGDAVFEMPDGTFWKVGSFMGGGLIRVKGLYGDDANEYIELIRIGR